MKTNRKTGSLPEDVKDLKKKNAALRKQVKELTAERDSYLRTLHGWAKQRISKETVEKWMAEEKIEGSLTEFIDEIRGKSS